MSKADKLLCKLKDGSINANELRTLFKQLHVEDRGHRGSHQKFSKSGKRFILATHDKDLKSYQIKEARDFLGVKDE